VRAALREHGLERRAGIAEGEDHLGSLCEAMRVLIANGTPIARQRAFFDAHIAPWYRACAEDFRSADGSKFYRCVANVLEAYFDVEQEALAIEEGHA
jgi:TorA maturation chaperone TorD